MDKRSQFTEEFLGARQEILCYILALVPNIQDAEEILHDTSVALWNKFDDFDQTQRFEPWACRFALNKTKQYWRTKKRAPLQLDDTVLDLIATDYADQATALANQRQDLSTCIKKLPFSERQLINQHYYKRMSIQDIAKSTSSSVHTLYKTIQRARRRLLRCMARSADGDLDGRQS